MHKVVALFLLLPGRSCLAFPSAVELCEASGGETTPRLQMGLVQWMGLAMALAFGGELPPNETPCRSRAILLLSVLAGDLYGNEL